MQEINLFEDIEDPRTVFTEDINGDGRHELLIGLENKILISDGSGSMLAEIPLDADMQLRQALDVTGDYIPEMIIGNLHTLTLSFLDGEGTLLAHHNFAPAWGLPPDHKGIITPLLSADIDGDERLEIISLVSAGYSLEPRGIFVFEYPSFSTQWFYSYPPQVGSTTIADIDDDGQVEVLIGSNNPCNITDSDRESDCLASVVALSSQGEKLWSKEVGYGFRRILVDCADVDGDGEVEIICSGWSFEDNWGTLFILDKKGEYIRGEENEFDYSLHVRNVSDLDHDGKKEIIAFLTGGNILIFDHMLNRIHEKKLDINTDRFTHIMVNDIDADGFEELIVAANDDALYILDKNLTVEHLITLPEPLEYGLFSVINLGGCKNDLIVLGKKLHVFSFQNDTESEPCPLWAKTERILKQEGTEYVTEGTILFNEAEYRKCLEYLLLARGHFEKVEDEESVALLTEKIMIASERIFKENIWIIIIAFVLWEVIFAFLLLYYRIVKKVWNKTSERAVVLTLPMVLGLVNVFYAEGQYVYIFIMYCFPSYAIASIIVLRENVTGFIRTLASILSGHKDMLVLSITRADGSYRVSVESIEERFMPVKESKSVSFPPAKKKDLLGEIRFMVETLGYYSQSIPASCDPSSPAKTLMEIGGAIYSAFIPVDFSEILKARFLLLEMEDTDIPWELMYSDTFFALKYAVSRRIITTESVITRKKLIPGKKALIICDPTDTLEDARMECDIVYERLSRKMDAVFLHGKEITKVKLANHLAQGYNIIHFAGHTDNGMVVSDGTMNFNEVKECIVGNPVVFVNGCRSEELARSFLTGGAIAYVGMIHPVHDKYAAEIAVDFYDLCFQYRVGEALRRARLKNVKKSMVWASLIMYGDPTIKLF
ncbi:MAG: CHAT domain-containing protein [Theionarchaea archaeon]|nr:CHAT domain-containing protein [Theionarchaea archaeon]